VRHEAVRVSYAAIARDAKDAECGLIDDVRIYELAEKP
jgi:hypothetical protein